ncbi:Outer membrane protein YfgL, lipoprotein component of the protein assembly complex (forms a complex with YaeT, YfiO, and NlpB) [plant metagenome]|uniref:Outer membrane protein assembly factor BamB n=2 Tax=root TaxID=1 RepID=A0A1C3K8K3_9BURK|nr:outer membrane protein assembly factor BamB [Orrella dioscoreae]SBT27833.1 Outer membrane protein YfgL, lipoprotein component of the protein assembly complex (forms a complex with YaeT, YfiO, and NlpB) [Orrella dioscoreae]SOE49256.1 Outer membrane protein YfgL, lipoprotein component of the protein assembly complex (forms a complex with YaeT, YfiO, and NlpB) [Orrella dioscoreae]
MLNLNFLRAARAAFCVTAALSLAGCGLFASDDGRYDPADLTDYAPGASAQVAWRTSIGSGGGIGLSPTVVDSAVYAASANGYVGKYDLLTGREVWRTRVDGDLTAGAGSDGVTTAVATPKGEVVAFDDTGKEKWRSRATSEVTVPPVVGYGLVIVRSGDYRIQAFNADSGERLWNVQRPGPALALRSSAQMILAEGMVIAGMPGGKMFAVQASTGNVQWEGTVATPKGSSDLERVTDVVGVPRVAGRLLCAVAYQGRVVCFDVSAGGRPQWARDFSSSVGLALDDRFLYVPDHTSVVHGFALDNGGNIWKQEALRNRRLSSPAVLGRAVALGDYDGYVHFLAREDGHLLARVSVGGGAIQAPLQATSQGVLVQTGNGDLVMISVN